MKTYLFTWNPAKWQWSNLLDQVRETQEAGFTLHRWSCGKSTKMKVGDRAFLMKLGKDGSTTNPRGIIGAGEIVSEYFVDTHWSGEEHKSTHYVNILFDVLFDPAQNEILDLEALKMIKPELLQQWAPQQSGISIKPEVAEELEKLWFNFIKDLHPELLEYNKKEEAKLVYEEGAALMTLSTRYERNPHARELRINNFGTSCAVCKIDFEKKYGDMGKGFIHVHHISPLAMHKGKYTVDPLKDLIPVCPNCHAMLHRKHPPYSVEELRERIEV